MPRTGTGGESVKPRKADRSGSGELGRQVVGGFGDEWSRFTNQSLADTELQEMFDLYATVFPWEELADDAVGFDAGCGSGRWATFFAPRVGVLHCIDASEAALRVARQTLRGQTNVEFHLQDLCELGLSDESCDFGYSLGVLHHIPDTELATASCVQKLKPGSPFLVYLYYDLEDRGWFQKLLLRIVTATRYVVARLPRVPRLIVADAIAAFVYWPMAKFAHLLDMAGRNPSWVPLFQYRRRSFYVMRNDALDRFGTRLEKRYSRDDVYRLLEDAGLENIVFAEGPPWWVAVGWRREDSR
jgi:SAM-dependent methyltransferase